MTRTYFYYVSIEITHTGISGSISQCAVILLETNFPIVHFNDIVYIQNMLMVKLSHDTKEFIRHVLVLGWHLVNKEFFPVNGGIIKIFRTLSIKSLDEI